MGALDFVFELDPSGRRFEAHGAWTRRHHALVSAPAGIAGFFDVIGNAGRSGNDFAAAIAAIDEILTRELLERGFVALSAIALFEDRPGPLKPECL